MDGQHWIPLNSNIQRETKVIKKSVSIQSGNYYLNKNIDYQRVKDWKKDFGFQQKIGWMKGVFMNTKSISNVYVIWRNDLWCWYRRNGEVWGLNAAFWLINGTTKLQNHNIWIKFNAVNAVPQCAPFFYSRKWNNCGGSGEDLPTSLIPLHTLLSPISPCLNNS